VSQPKYPQLTSPSLSIEEDGTPVSGRFGDVYFSRADGMEETRHVFINGIGAPECWANQDSYTIAETGFGTGLNFLLTWSEWLKAAPRNAQLHYISLEGFPLTAGELETALEAFPSLAPQTGELLESYPSALPGYHHHSLQMGRVKLTLMFGEAAKMLSQLRASVDAWYLDGFAPSKNPEMWREEVLDQVARLSKPGAHLATFTAAGAVRRGLAERGFTMRKVPGFGYKRECLQGTFEGAHTELPAEKPWFRPPPPMGTDKRVALIGGGIAGCSAAYALKRSGCKPIIIERHKQLANEASGNPAGILTPRLTIGDTPSGRFHAAGLIQSINLYNHLHSSGHDIWLQERGVMTMARDEEERTRQQRLVSEHALPEEFAKIVDAEEALQLSGLKAPLGGIWYGTSGCIRPANVCNALAEGIEQIQGSADHLEKSGSGWRVLNKQGALLCEADAVVLTNGPMAAKFFPGSPLTITANRGQITYLPPTDLPHTPFSFGGYLSPPFDGMRVLGSTYDRWMDPENSDWERITEEHQDRCLNILKKHQEVFCLQFRDIPLRGRAALRAVTPDRMPLVGPLPIVSAYQSDYVDLHHGRKGVTYPPATYAENLFVLAGLGSRGFQTALPCAESLAAMITGTPMPLETDVLDALHPGRFILHGLRRGPK